MRLIISLAALLLSAVLVQLGSGALGPLDVLSGVARGFTNGQIGLLGSGHYAGFFIGCWMAPRLMGSVGHSRAFAVFAASGAIGSAAHPLWYDPTFWAVLRVMSGISVAGAYTVIEGWLQAKVTNDNRGRLLGVYRLVDLSASLAAQMMIAVLPPAEYVSYNILSILACLCLLPLTLTTAKAPVIHAAPRLRPLAAIRLSPLGAAGVLATGAAMPAFRMVGPIYGQQIGLDASGIAFLLAAAVLGGAVAQIPVGWIADKYDRRWVLVALSIACVAVSGWIALAGAGSLMTVYGGAFLFGLVAYPVFSISAAHANDFAKPEGAAELNASLMFLYGVGAILSPYAAAQLLTARGPGSLWVFIAAVHAVLAVFSLWRMAVRPAAARRTPYRYLPRTSFTISRLLRRRDETAPR